MNASAITLMIIAMLVVWGGLIAAIMFLRSRSDVEVWPAGGEDDDHRADEALVPRAT